MTTTLDTLQIIRKRANLADDAKIGIVGSFGKTAEIVSKGRVIKWVANTSDIDMEDEVVVPEGLDPSRYFDKNRAIFLDHRYETMYKIGIMRSRVLVDGPDGRKQWQVNAYIMPTELGNAVWAMAEEGGGMPCSIGFSALDCGQPTPEESKKYTQRGMQPRSIVRKSDWIELSATAIPMNVSCQGVIGEPNKSALTLIDSLVSKSRITRNAAVMMGHVEAKRRFTVSMVKHSAVVSVGGGV